MPSCSTVIERNTVSWLCNLDQGHLGPHSAPEDAKSLRERAAWVEAQEAKAALAAVQGEAQTTAQRYTANPTPVPGTESQVINGIQVRKEGASTCSACFAGNHEGCLHRSELIAVFFHDKEAIDVFCHCFQSQTVEHGITSIEALVAEATSIKAAAATSVPAEPVQTEPSKQRDGDQPLPQLTGQEPVQQRIIEKMRVLYERGEMPEQTFKTLEAAMLESMALGIQRYGTPLQTFNGRDTLKDAVDEARDLFVYLSAIHQAIQAERDGMVEIVETAVRTANESGASMSLDAVVRIAVDTILGAFGGWQWEGPVDD